MRHLGGLSYAWRWSLTQKNPEDQHGMAFLIGLFCLFLLACLAYWWVRGGVIPAIMLTLPLLAALSVLAISMLDTMAGKAQPSAALPVAMLVLLGFAAVVWTPCLLARRRRVAPR